MYQVCIWLEEEQVTYQGMGLEPADMQRVVTMIQGELGGGETVRLWSME